VYLNDGRKEDNMGAKTTVKKVQKPASKSKTNVQKPRKATFAVNTVKGETIYTPVNKRAKTMARKLGKRTRVTLADLKKSKGMGTYKPYQYTDSGELKAIRV
jgi:hypothetical protein